MKTCSARTSFVAYPASVGRPVTDRAAALHIGHMLSRVALTGTIVRLGEALPVVFFSSAVDFILPVNCRRSTTAVRAASGTAGKMNSPKAEPRHAGRHACARKEYHRKRLAEAHNSPRQRHAREHVSNVQRGGTMSHGKTDGSRNKPQNTLSQSRFSPICCGRWLKIVLKTDQVKRKLVQRKRH